MSRFLPGIVVAAWVVLLSAGVPVEVLRVPALASLSVSLLVAAASETLQARSERRHTPDRRKR